MDDVCICTTEPRPRVLHGPNGSRYGDELLDLVGTCHDGAYRGQGQLLGPSNPRLESLMGFKRRGSLCDLEYLAPARGGKGVMRVRSIPATLGRLPTFYGASES